MALAVLPQASAGKLFGIFGSDKGPPPIYYQKKPGQLAAIEKPALVDVAQPCANYAWGAALETMLRSHDVSLPHQDLIFRLYGGKLCISPVPSFDDLAAKVSHSYVLADGKHIRLEAQYLAGPPTAADPLILSIRQRHPVLIVWKGRPMLLVGLLYDEYIGPNGTRIFVVQELKLLDPAAPAEKQQLSFLRERDDPNQLEGWMQIDVRAELPGEIPKDAPLR